MSKPSVKELVELAHAAAAEAANFQERFAAEDTEARKIVDIMERFLRMKGRVVYGGAAINAHLSPARKFYDPRLYLPDYDFMTPDPLQDCADLIVAFQEEGFTEVEAKFGIHEGTYKVFVNYRAAADITYMPPEIYTRVVEDSETIDGIRYASVNFLRMNMYLELSRPAGMVSRWEKVYQRLLLLNEEHPLRAGRCTANPLAALGTDDYSLSSAVILHSRIVDIGIATGAVFLSGASYLAEIEPSASEVVMMITNQPKEVVAELKSLDLRATEYPAQGELLPARTEFRTKQKRLVAVVFETVACHSYTTLPEPEGYRLGSLDLLIQMYYAMYFADLQGYLPVRLLCVIQQLIDMEFTSRIAAVEKGYPAHDVFPMDCIGHQPTMPELKKAHRERVREKRDELKRALRINSNFRMTRRKAGLAVRSFRASPRRASRSNAKT
jgi:hypothetical protein